MYVLVNNFVIKIIN